MTNTPARRPDGHRCGDRPLGAPRRGDRVRRTEFLNGPGAADIAATVTIRRTPSPRCRSLWQQLRNAGLASTAAAKQRGQRRKTKTAEIPPSLEVCKSKPRKHQSLLIRGDRSVPQTRSHCPARPDSCSRTRSFLRTILVLLAHPRSLRLEPLARKLQRPAVFCNSAHDGVWRAGRDFGVDLKRDGHG